MRNITWYTRNGHLDFLARLSLRLKAKDNDIKSFYVCHTPIESERLFKGYGISPYILGDYLKNSKRSYGSTEKQIRELEERYDFIPLRRLLWSEMYEKNFTEEEMADHLIAHFEFWEKFLTGNQIEGVVSERPSILSTSVLWAVCKKLGIKFVDFINIGLDGRIVFSSSWYGDIEGFERKFNEVAIQGDPETYAKAQAYLRKMTKAPEKPEYIFRNLMTGQKIERNKLYKRFPKVGNIFQLPIRWKRAVKSYSYYVNGTLGEHFSSLAMLHFRSWIHQVANMFDKNLDPTKERYFLFPLHICHEWSNYPWMGLRYPNIVRLIDEVAACLPVGCKLYVKEHTTNFPERSFSFYRAIKKIRQVRLLDRFENTFELIKNSEGVITLGSTMGWETFLVGKPVIIFGEAWYKHLPGIYRANTNEQLVSLLQNIKQQPLATEDDKIRAICALYEISFEAKRYPVIELIAQENVEKYMEPFESWLQDKEGAVIYDGKN